ncbi:MAG: hypothetical protein ACYDA1_09425 [Vulcanimicrobiaceae bacterium]
MIIETSRLHLRPLTDADNDSYLAMAPVPRASAEAVAHRLPGSSCCTT